MNNSGANTIILLLILVVLIFGAVWFLKSGTEESTTGLEVDLNFPTQEETN